MKKKVLSAILALTAFSNAGTISIVIAPDLNDIIKNLNEAFLKTHPNVHIKVISEVSGAAYQQMLRGYPVDIFMSADTNYPKMLIKEDKAFPNSYYTYAIGKLVLWTGKNINFSNDCISTAAYNTVKKVAIANPKVAPYGRASIKALESKGIYNIVKPKIVFGANVAQTLQFAQTKAADIAFSPLSLVVKPGVGGKYCFIPQNLYPPIAQGMVILKNSKDLKDAYDYLSFIKSKEAKSIFKSYGFVTY